MIPFRPLSQIVSFYPILGLQNVRMLCYSVPFRRSHAFWPCFPFFNGIFVAFDLPRTWLAICHNPVYLFKIELTHGLRGDTRSAKGLRYASAVDHLLRDIHWNTLLSFDLFFSIFPENKIRGKYSYSRDWTSRDSIRLAVNRGQSRFMNVIGFMGGETEGYVEIGRLVTDVFRGGGREWLVFAKFI